MGNPVIRWLGNSDIIRQIQAADPGVPKATWALRSPALPWLLVGADAYVAGYRSFARFQADVAANAIDPRYHWVLYDPENWPDTPLAEQQDPWTWLPRFGQYGHSCGYRVICAPARDLGNVANTAQPKRDGEPITSWYLRTGIAPAAASHADIVSVQSQALTEDPDLYETFVTGAANQARRANPFVKVFAGVSTAYGSAAQMAAAARSVQVDGVWLNVPGPAPDIAKACEFLRLMEAG